jgi:DNA polymerase V
MIDGLYAKDIAFKKCGVILTCLEPKASHVYDMFTDMKHRSQQCLDGFP